MTCAMLIFYMCVFLILHPAYKYSFLKHINGARLQSSAGTSAPCHQLCSSWDPNWGWHGSSTRRAALLSGLGDIPKFPFGTSLPPSAGVGLWVSPGAAPCPWLTQLSFVLINTKQKGKAANSWIHLPCLFISWPCLWLLCGDTWHEV